MEFTRLNPVTLITGAASGIGQACAKELARQSQGGLILIDFDERALADAADDLEALNVAPERVSMLAFDVTDPDRWAQASSFIHSQYGRLDWAFLNAGAASTARVEESDLVDWGGATSANLEGALLTLRTVIPLMRENAQGGAVVVSAPAAAVKAEPAKAGLVQLIRAAAKEGAPSVRINGLAPGGAQTPMWASMPWFNDLVKETGSEPAAFDRIAKLATPLARYAKTDDVARLITMLLSDESPISGATLIVDGGYTL